MATSETADQSIAVDDSHHAHHQHKSAFMEFLQQLATFTGDLSQLTAPSFLLNGISLLEYSTHWLDYPQLFAQIPQGRTAEDRMVAAVKWYLSTLPGSYHERCVTGSEKKPYNPILGEQFHCQWKDEQQKWKEARMMVEQVSHHPPVTAFHAEIPSAGVSLYGHYGQKSKFKGTFINATQLGKTTFHIEKFNETYQAELPEIHIRGIFSGKIFLDLSGSVRITASTGLVATIEFLPKPWFSGDYHYIKGTISAADGVTPLYSLSGRWVEEVFIEPAAGGGPEQKSLLLHHSQEHRPSNIVRPLAEQSDLESRKVWHRVTEALQKHDFGHASKEKSEIEEHQRALRKQRAKNGEVWKPALFRLVEPSMQQPVLTKGSLAPATEPYWTFLSG